MMRGNNDRDERAMAAGHSRALLAMLALLATMVVATPTALAERVGYAPAESGSDDSTAQDSGEGDEGATTAGGEGGTSFEAAELSNQETPHYTLMIVAYLAMWLLLLGYAFVLFRRQRAIDGDLAELRERLATLDDIVDDELEP